MLRHMSNIFEDLQTYLPTDRPTFPVLYASLLRRSIKKKTSEFSHVRIWYLEFLIQLFQFEEQTRSVSFNYILIQCVILWSLRCFYLCRLLWKNACHQKNWQLFWFYKVSKTSWTPTTYHWAQVEKSKSYFKWPRFGKL